MIHRTALLNASCAVGLVLTGALAWPASAQQPANAPVVGVATAQRRSVATTYDFVGRIEAPFKVDLRARVVGFLEKRLFEEGAEVAEGQPLFQIEQAQFVADVDKRKAELAAAAANHAKAKIDLSRAETLVRTAAGTQARVDDAIAAERQSAAAVSGAEAALKQAQINLDYTTIIAPVGGKIGKSVFSVGAVVGPDAGTMATVVSQDPMRVAFPVAVRQAFAIRDNFSASGATAAKARVRIRLPDGSPYPHVGVVDFVDTQVDRNTDTIMVRATIPNPGKASGTKVGRDLVDGAVVSVTVDGPAAAPAIVVPREALLLDQQGPYVLTVDKQSRVELRRLKLGQGDATTAAVEAGLEEGDVVIVEGVQRARPGQPVKAEPVGGAGRR